MKSTVPLIVLGYTRFGENSIVVHTLGREYGRRSFLVRIGKKTGMAMFLPLNILEGTVVENPKSSLWTAHGFSSLYPLDGIRNNIYKNSMTLFLSEVLWRTVKEGTSEEGLFDWCVKEILTLDGMESNFENFHLRFLLDMAEALGFKPTVEDMAPFAGERLEDVRRLIEEPLAGCMLIPLSGDRRTEICQAIIRYLEYHTESTLNIRSLAVLHELFA